MVIDLNVRRKLSVGKPVSNIRVKKFALNVRHHFHTLEYFIITVYFSVEKMYEEFPFSKGCNR